MPAGDELGQGQLGLFPARQGARVLEGHLADEAEHTEQATQLGFGGVRLVAQVVDDGHGRPTMPSCSWA